LKGDILRRLPVLLFLCFCVFPAWAQNDAGDALRPVLEKRYAELKTAMAERDSKTLSALLTPDFVSEDISGKTTSAEEMLKELAALPKDTGKVTETTLVSIKPQGDLAIVEQRYHMTTTKTLPDGNKQAIDLMTLSTDTWAHAGDKWLMKRTITNQIDYSVDGKPVLHKVHS
jgi:hypothetical protein